MNQAHEKPAVEIDRGARPGGVERAFVILVLLLGSGAFLVLVSSEGEYGQAGGHVFEVIWAVAYLVMLWLLCFRVRDSALGILKEFPIVLLPVMALVSTEWSDNPAITFRRSVALWLTVMFGYYLAKRFSLREQLHLLAWVCGISIFFSYPFGLLHVTRSGDAIEGAWNGIFGQKNILGGMMALSILVFLVLAKVEPERRWRMRLGILSALVLLALSRSAGAVVVTALMFLLVPLAGILRKSFAKTLTGMALTAMGGTVALFWVLTHFGVFASALGKGETMSGRVQLWGLCIIMALQKPWLGYGYGAFWLGMNGPSFRILRVLPSPANSRAHDAFLQTWLNLGLVGVGLLAIIFVVYIIRAALLVRQTRQPEAVWPLMILAFYLLYGLTETFVPSENSLPMMIFSCCIFAVSAPLLARARSETSKESGYAGQRDIGHGMGATAPGTSSA